MTGVLSKNWVLCCSCHKKAKSLDTGIWINMPQLIKRLETMPFSHGYCPECYAVALGKILVAG